MLFLQKEIVIEKIKQSILKKEVVNIQYQHVTEDQDIVVRKKAPFDIGTTNPKTIESNKNNLYAFCYDHLDKETNMKKPMVHPINIDHIVSIEPTGEIFDEKELSNIHMTNTGYDYTNCQFALLPDRNWFN